MASGDKCLPEEFMTGSGAAVRRSLQRVGPAAGARAAKQASGPVDQPAHEVEQVQAPPDWLDEGYQGRQSKRRR
jgi:hypothetical protein